MTPAKIFALRENQNKRNDKNFYLDFYTLDWEGKGKIGEVEWRLQNASFQLDLHQVTKCPRIRLAEFYGKSKNFQFTFTQIFFENAKFWEFSGV